MAYVTVTAGATRRYLFPSLPELVVRFGTEPPLPQLLLPQYISRYIWHETQMPGSQHLHDLIWINHQNVSDNTDLPEPTPEPPCLSDSALTILKTRCMTTMISLTYCLKIVPKISLTYCLKIVPKSCEFYA